MRIPCLLFAALIVCATGLTAQDEESLSIALFEADATPPLGTPIAYTPAKWIVDPLKVRGFALLGKGKPVVLMAIDAIGTYNEGHDAWREVLAEAAGTTPDRVAVQSLHQHDATRWGLSTEQIRKGEGDGKIDPKFALRAMTDAAKALKAALEKPVRVTHLGMGKGRVEKVASNRRVLGPDGKVKIVRWSSTKNPEAIAAPEGLIDPDVRLLCFWNGDRPVASVTYYATHPQSYYRKGGVSADFVGMARSMREGDEPRPMHIHFNGAGGNITAGKYNDGSYERRPILAMRLARGMKHAWEDAAEHRVEVSAADLAWRIEPVSLPVADHVAADNAFRKRMEAGHKIEVSCLKLGPVYVLHLPGELFVEYQLAAQKLKPDGFVCMAAYGDGGPGYIGTEISYGQGGYETSERASRVKPSVEKVLMDAIRKLLR